MDSGLARQGRQAGRRSCSEPAKVPIGPGKLRLGLHLLQRRKLSSTGEQEKSQTHSTAELLEGALPGEGNSPGPLNGSPRHLLDAPFPHGAVFTGSAMACSSGTNQVPRGCPQELFHLRRKPLRSRVQCLGPFGGWSRAELPGVHQCPAPGTGSLTCQRLPHWNIT